MKNKLFFSSLVLISGGLVAVPGSQEGELPEASQPATPTPRPAALQIPSQQVRVPFFTAQEIGVRYPADISPRQYPTQMPFTLEQTPPPAPRVEIADQENDRFAQHYQDIASNLSYLLHDLHGSREQRIEQLNGVIQEARHYSHEVQDNGNAAYRTSGGFHHRFGLIVRDAETRIAHINEGVAQGRAITMRAHALRGRHGAEHFLTRVTLRSTEDLAHLREVLRNLLERYRNNDRGED